MGVASFLSHFAIDQFYRTPPPCTRSFANETVIITGGNTGLGKEAARQIVALGADKVIITSRDASEGEQAKRDIEAATSRAGVVEVWTLDLASYESVKAFATRCNGLARIDAVLMNAGVFMKEYTKAEDNESTITVNVVSTFLLMLLLLPRLREIAKSLAIHPRVCVLTSDLYEVAPFKARAAPAGQIFASMNDASTSMASRYEDTKLIEILYVLAFVETQEWKGSQEGVVVNLVNPGFAVSELMRETTDIGFRTFRKLLARSTEEGARAHVYAAASGPESHGMYQNNGKSVPLLTGTWPTTKNGQEVGRRAFEAVNEKLEKIVPGVTGNI